MNKLDTYLSLCTEVYDFAEVSNIIEPGHYKNINDLKARILEGRKQLKEIDDVDYV